MYCSERSSVFKMTLKKNTEELNGFLLTFGLKIEENGQK